MKTPNSSSKRINRIWISIIILAILAILYLYFALKEKEAVLALLNDYFVPSVSEKIIIIVPALITLIVIPLLVNFITSGSGKKPNEEPVENNKPESSTQTVVIKHEYSQPETKQTESISPANQKFLPTYFLPDLRFFVGRKDVLKKIEETLERDHRAAIHDISGLGKTFTTYKYVSEPPRNYEKIFFVRATREEMLESLAKCGEAVDPNLTSVQEQQAKALGFKQWLEENENWLVIYDNVDLPEELFPFVPANLKGDCLFTSNFREITNLGTEINIVKFARTDAEILLYSRAINKPYQPPELRGEEKEAFDNLVREIDGLPLTLNSTGALVDKKEWTFVRTWQKYQNTSELVWESEDDYSVYQRKSAGIVFSLAYSELSQAEKVGNAVKILLDSMTFISPDEIPEDLLEEILRNQYEPFAKMKDSEDFWDEVREQLTEYDLLKYDKYKKLFTTHRSIQRVIQTKIKPAEKKAICEKLVALFLDLFPLCDYFNKEICEKYYLHVQTLLENTDKLQIETENINILYHRISRYQELLGNYGQAEIFYRRAAEISAEISGNESADHAIDLNNLAGVYESQGRYEEAIEKYEEVLRIAEKTIGKEHPDYASSLNNLGEVYRLQGRYDEAIEKYEEALRIDEKTIGKEHLGYATDLNNLALAYEAQGRYEEAIEKYEEALRIAEKTIGNEHPYYARGLNNLALVYKLQGRYEEAIKKFEEALRIGEKTIDREHPDHATRLNNLALVFHAQGKYEQALPMFEKALGICVKAFGEDHPTTRTVKGNLESCRGKMKGK